MCDAPHPWVVNAAWVVSPPLSLSLSWLATLAQKGESSRPMAGPNSICWHGSVSSWTGLSLGRYADAWRWWKTTGLREHLPRYGPASPLSFLGFHWICIWCLSFHYACSGFLGFHRVLLGSSKFLLSSLKSPRVRGSLVLLLMRKPLE